MNALLTATERLRGISLTMLFLDHLEGNRPYAYPDTSGKWTIGIGHLLSKEELQSGKLLIDNQPYPWAYERRDYPQSPGLSPGAISALLGQDLRPIVSQEPPGILEQRLRVPLTGPQIAALASFVFNLGQATFVESKCTLLRRLNQGDYLAVPSELRRWVWGKDPQTGKRKIVPGLRVRREKEVLMWEGKGMTEITQYSVHHLPVNKAH